MRDDIYEMSLCEMRFNSHKRVHMKCDLTNFRRILHRMLNLFSEFFKVQSDFMHKIIF